MIKARRDLSAPVPLKPIYLFVYSDPCWRSNVLWCLKICSNRIMRGGAAIDSSGLARMHEGKLEWGGEDPPTPHPPEFLERNRKVFPFKCFCFNILYMTYMSITKRIIIIIIKQYKKVHFQDILIILIYHKTIYVSFFLPGNIKRQSNEHSGCTGRTVYVTRHTTDQRSHLHNDLLLL